jgi:hypothetical protein
MGQISWITFAQQRIQYKEERKDRCYLVQSTYSQKMIAKEYHKLLEKELGKAKYLVRIQVEERTRREGIAKPQEWAEIALRKKPSQNELESDKDVVALAARPVIFTETTRYD